MRFILPSRSALQIVDDKVNELIRTWAAARLRVEGKATADAYAQEQKSPTQLSIVPYTSLEIRGFEQDPIERFKTCCRELLPFFAEKTLVIVWDFMGMRTATAAFKFLMVPWAVAVALELSNSWNDFQNQCAFPAASQCLTTIVRRCTGGLETTWDHPSRRSTLRCCYAHPTTGLGSIPASNPEFLLQHRAATKSSARRLERAAPVHDVPQLWQKPFRRDAPE